MTDSRVPGRHSVKRWLAFLSRHVLLAVTGKGTQAKYTAVAGQGKGLSAEEHGFGFSLDRESVKILIFISMFKGM